MAGLWLPRKDLLMSYDVAIKVEGLSKSFPVYEKPHHRLMQMIVGGARDRWFREFHALTGVNLSVNRGETLGIIGRNGSGKSTLLQVICGTLAPTLGSVAVQGRIAALLELGTGFNPEFTGRENVYLNASVLGLSRSEIDARFDEIAAFADIGDFIEQPVKCYSSGMYVRLAFAVAINVTPDILVIDEALSVGDEAFQRKCFARINAIRDAGATVLFVSHSAGTVVELCDRAILMDRGEMISEGTPKFVVSRYHKLLYAGSDQAGAIRAAIQKEFQSGSAADDASPELIIDATIIPDPAGLVEAAENADKAYFDEGLIPQSTLGYQQRGARIIDPHIETEQGRRVNVLTTGGQYIYTYQVAFEWAAAAVRCGMMIKTTTGFELGGAATAAAGCSELIVVPGQQLLVRFQFRALLAPGVYFLNAGVTAHDVDGEIYMDRLVDAAMLRIMPDRLRTATGCVNFDVTSELHAVSQEVTA
jgi:lipopolysaccharide transport system ATP-binding protein